MKGRNAMEKLQRLLDQRKLPALLSRHEMLQILLENVYGFLPPAPEEVHFDVQEKFIPIFCAGNAICNKVVAVCTLNSSTFSFPFYTAIPTDNKKHPFFVHINFRDNISDWYQPAEELIDNGFAVLSFNYKDVTSDDTDFTNGLAGLLYPDGVRKEAHDCGKIAMWAWAAHRVMDYAETLTEQLDLTTAVVCGHSRLGKTALLTAATDERFTYAYSNGSGCAGAAITRMKLGERVKEICRDFPQWFCENYKNYIDHEENMPFDQHYLVASIAPRKVMVGSADGEHDPLAEQLCCLAASPAFKTGFICPDREAEVGDEFLEGDVAFQMRKGLHYFSRQDWQKLIKFVNLHRSN